MENAIEAALDACKKFADAAKNDGLESTECRDCLLAYQTARNLLSDEEKETLDESISKNPKCVEAQRMLAEYVRRKMDEPDSTLLRALEKLCGQPVVYTPSQRSLTPNDSTEEGADSHPRFTVVCGSYSVRRNEDSPQSLAAEGKRIVSDQEIEDLTKRAEMLAKFGQRKAIEFQNCSVLATQDSRFTVEGYFLVHRTMELLSGNSNEIVASSPHAICAEVIKVARTDLGDRARDVLSSWGIRSTEDIGSIVIHIGREWWDGEPDYQLEDFAKIFDLADEFGSVP